MLVAMKGFSDQGHSQRAGGDGSKKEERMARGMKFH